ncbi:DUF5134 domain-containing protein [Streptomyces sp. NPDC059063]|uniref:DUF5134 domain-containing protein n=1 Tax=unclassified Streptomyces TaxID=2593676 RepID=UPI003699D506
MHGPGSASWLLVALCAASGAYCLLRMRSHVEEQRRTAGGEALMGFGMALMAVPGVALSSPPGVLVAYVAVFAAAGLRAAWAVRRRPHHDHAHHLVGAVAMVYMSGAMAVTPGAGHGGAGVPALTGALLLYFTAHVLASGARLAPVGAVVAPETGVVHWADRPELALVCRLAMSMAMIAMLLTL